MRDLNDKNVIFERTNIYDGHGKPVSKEKEALINKAFDVAFKESIPEPPKILAMDGKPITPERMKHFEHIKETAVRDTEQNTVNKTVKSENIKIHIENGNRLTPAERQEIAEMMTELVNRRRESQQETTTIHDKNTTVKEFFDHNDKEYQVSQRIKKINTVEPKPAHIGRDRKDPDPIREYQNQAKLALASGHALDDKKIAANMLTQGYKPTEISKALDTASPNALTQGRSYGFKVIQQVYKLPEVKRSKDQDRSIGR